MLAKRLALRALTALLVLAVAWLSTGRLRLEQDDRTDEPEWTAISVVTARQLSGATPPGVQRDRNAGDLADDAWRQGVQATTFGWSNPILHKLVWAAACEPVAPERLRPNLFFRYHKGDPARANAAIQPLLPAIERARLVVAAASALCGLLLFLIAKRLVGWPGGVIALALWLFHPLVRAWSHQARPDFGMLALVLATLYVALASEAWLRGSRGRGKQLGAAALLGLVAGLAAGAKLNGGLAGVFAVGAVLVAALAGTQDVPSNVEAPTRPSWVVTLGALALTGTAFTFTLFACLPYLWSAPIEHMSDVLDFWSEHMAFQQDRIEALGGTATRTTGEQVALVAGRIGGADEPLQAALGVPAGWLWIGALAGGWWQLRRRAAAADEAAEAGATSARRVPLRLTLLWLVVVLLGSTLWIPLEWDRYLFAPVSCAILLQAVVIGAILRRLVAKARPRSLSAESPSG